MKQAVTQEHSMGCAVACVAYVLNCTYQEALTLFENREQAYKKGFYCKEIVNALRKAEKMYRYRQVKFLTKDKLNIPNTIVFIEKTRDYPAGHYLVRTSEGFWMNPWINFPLIVPAKGGFELNLRGKPIIAIFPTPSQGA